MSLVVSADTSNAETASPEAGTASRAARPRGYVCMVAYTNYVIDARVRREAETLAARGFHVRCLTNRHGETPTSRTIDGVEVRELAVPKYRGKSTLAYMVSYLRFLLHASVACMKLVWKNEADVVHVHNLPDFLVFAGLFPRLMGRKVILDIHDSMPETFATKFSDSGLIHRALCLQERMSALVANRVICVNDPQRDTLVARGLPLDKTFITMNVPDPRIFGASSDERPPVDDGLFHLVYHGTMAERLGVDLVIRAVAQLQHAGSRVRLHLWGNGDDLDSFQRLARELGMSESVEFNPKGYPLEQLPARLRQMHVGVVGNRRSVAGDLMLPVKLLEYVALGIPAVVPRLRTIEHYFSDDMVCYFEAGNVESLAACLQRLQRQPDLRRAQAERARTFLDKYGWERKGAELVALYESMVKRERI
jgi:glycosyltransferase involved in cell wall biosynthesis